VVPADNKWFTRLIVSSVMIKAIADLELSYPTISAAAKAELAAARARLDAE
jgi:hypothetical protein